MATVRSRPPAARAPEVLGQSQITWAWFQCLRQMGQAITRGSVEWAATPVFAMPAEVPEAAKGPYPLTERVRAVEPGCVPDRLLGIEPNRRSAACLTEMVPVIPISPYPMVAQHRSKVA